MPLAHSAVGAETPRTDEREDGNVLPFVFVVCLLYFAAAWAGPPVLVLVAVSAYLGRVPAETPQPDPDFSEPHFSKPKRWEPVFNVPRIVVATVIVLVLVHLVRTYVLTDEEDDAFLLAFAFIPARYGTDLAISGSFPGGFGADIWTFFSYAFIHADLMHLGFNLAWLIPFGTALARRFGAWRYSLFMLVMAAAGALAHLVSNLGAMEPMIGASAAISGAMAAAMRFVFQERGPLGVFRNAADGGYHAPAAPLSKTLRDPRFLLFVGVWLGLNALFGLGTISFGQEAGQQIAWQAHVGGFFAGLLLFSAFDPVVSRAGTVTDG
jgi:membrane associated rhomboid family serine protease